MLRIYKMPSGIKRQYDDANVPEGAVLVTVEKKVEKPAAKVETEEEVKVEEKAVEPKNKAVQTPKTKTKKGSKK